MHLEFVGDTLVCYGFRLRLWLFAAGSCLCGFVLVVLYFGGVWAFWHHPLSRRQPPCVVGMAVYPEPYESHFDPKIAIAYKPPKPQTLRAEPQTRNLRPCTLYTLYTVYTLYTAYTLHTLYTLCTLYTLIIHPTGFWQSGRRRTGRARRRRQRWRTRRRNRQAPVAL